MYMVMLLVLVALTVVLALRAVRDERVAVRVPARVTRSRVTRRR